MPQQKELLTSEFISTIAQKEHRLASEEVNRLDREFGDLRHILELENCKGADRNRLGTKMQTNLRARRKEKDLVEVLTPFIDWCGKNEKAINTLREVLGETRKIEKRRKYRTHTFRELSRKALVTTNNPE